MSTVHAAPTTSPRRSSGLKAWLGLLNATLNAVEQTAWQGRALAENAWQHWLAAQAGLEGARAEYEALRDEAAIWPARVKRLSENGWMLARITTAYRLWGTRSAFMSRARAEQTLQSLHRRQARLFVDTSLRQGGAFLKIGQLLSARGDILPAAWVDELQVLQDRAQAESFDTIRHTLEQSLGQPLDALFSDFDPQPIASASIGQVHAATLHDGRRVAVKVQRPGLTELIALDMSLLRLFVQSIASLLPPTDLDTIVGEIERTLGEELNYRHEAHWMNTVRTQLADVNGVLIPEVIWSHSNDKVLVSEFIDGINFGSELDRRQQAGDDAGVSDLLGRLLDLYLRQVLQFGVFQADPHPGNLLVTADDTLVLLDFGATMELSPAFRDGYQKVLGAALTDNRAALVAALDELGFRTRSGQPDTLLAFTEALIGQLRKAAMLMGSGEMVWPDTASMLAAAEALLAQAHDDPVDTLPAEFIMLARVFTTIGGLFVQYQPTLDINRYLIPHLVGPAFQAIQH